MVINNRIKILSSRYNTYITNQYHLLDSLVIQSVQSIQVNRYEAMGESMSAMFGGSEYAKQDQVLFNLVSRKVSRSYITI